MTFGPDVWFYTLLLQRLKAPETRENFLLLWAWRQAEGGDFRFNPFNTTLAMPKSTPRGKHGIRDYANAVDGIEATAKTIEKYPSLHRALRESRPAEEIAEIIVDGNWGTSDLLYTVLDGYRKGRTIKARPIAGGPMEFLTTSDVPPLPRDPRPLPPSGWSALPEERRVAYMLGFSLLVVYLVTRDAYANRRR